MNIINSTKQFLLSGTEMDWIQYQESIQNGQCTGISERVVSFLKQKYPMLPVKVCHGFIRYPVPVFSNDIHEEETYELRHWWVVIDRQIFEFAKGTLKNGVISRNHIDVGNLDCVSPPDGFMYIPN